MNAIVPADFGQGQMSTKFAPPAAGSNDLAGSITGGYGLIGYRGKVWSIRHKGDEKQLMRDDGDGPRGSIDVVILKANPHLSKNWYENGFVEGSNAPPDCSSANGIYPDANVPKKQNNICATCPKNAWGSAVGGSGKGKACGDHRRLAVVPITDLKNELFGGPLLLRCPAASLQDMAAFSNRLEQLGYQYYAVGVKIGFDPKESFPKFTFTALRPLSDAEADIVLEHRASDAVARVISDVVDPAMQAEALAAPQVDPSVAALPPKVAAPAPAPAPAPAAVAPAPASAGGFGPAAPVQQPTQSPAPQATTQAPEQPTVAAPPPVKPAPAMTGFGPTTAPAAQPTQSFEGAADGTKPVDGAAQDAFVESLDDRLNKLLG